MYRLYLSIKQLYHYNSILFIFLFYLIIISQFITFFLPFIFQVYRLYLSIKQLAETLPAEVGKLRYFGQIRTTGKKPYVIVEGLNPEDEEGIDELLQEGKNGGNKYAYWVARSTTAQPSEWIKLPNFTSDQIIKARLFKRFLSGDLETEIPSYPLFPGLEKNLLRVQIARIVGM